jgi:hypothetical protein
MRAGRIAATSPVNPGFRFGVQECGGEVGRNIEGDTTGTRVQGDDWVTLAIRDDGSYDFVSARTIGIFQGQGTCTLIDGKLKTETERGWAITTLYEEGGWRMLKVEGATKDGVQYSADLASAN